MGGTVPLAEGAASARVLWLSGVSTSKAAWAAWGWSRVKEVRGDEGRRARGGLCRVLEAVVRGGFK